MRKFIVLLFAFFACSLVVNGQQTPLTVNISSASGNVGEQVCLELTVDDFEKLNSMQFVIRFDPSVIAYDTILLANSGINQSGGAISIGDFNTDLADQGFVNLVWIDFGATGITLVDGDTLMTMCFDIVGEPCDESDIVIVSTADIEIEIGKIDCDTGYEYYLELSLIHI